MDTSKAAKRLASVDKRIQAARSLNDPLCGLLDCFSTDVGRQSREAGLVGFEHHLSTESITWLPLYCKFYRYAEMPAALFEWAFQLTEVNMKNLYSSSAWGWNGPAKRTEMSSELSCYLLLFDGSQSLATSNPCAFAHFQFVEDFGREVLYCWELQVSAEYQRKNMGKLLMMILEVMAWNCKLGHVVLTCFKHNTSSMSFYKNLGYDVDETDPSRCGNNEDICYTILSKATRRKPEKAIEFIAERLNGRSSVLTLGR